MISEWGMFILFRRRTMTKRREWWVAEVSGLNVARERRDSLKQVDEHDESLFPGFSRAGKEFK